MSRTPSMQMARGASNQTTAEGAQIDRYVKGLHEFLPDRSVATDTPPRNALPNDYGFRAKYHKVYDDEKRLRTEDEYVAQANIQRTYPVDVNKHLEIAERKEKELQLRQFDDWLQQFFNIYDPAHQRILRELEPEFYQRRWEVIEDHLETQRMIARIKLFGVQTKEDLMFCFAIRQGFIQLPQGTAFDTRQGGPADERMTGLLNFKEWIRSTFFARGDLPLFDGVGNPTAAPTAGGLDRTAPGKYQLGATDVAVRHIRNNPAPGFSYMGL